MKRFGKPPTTVGIDAQGVEVGKRFAVLEQHGVLGLRTPGSTTMV